MRLLEALIILLLFISMVSCGAQGCSWEKTTDAQGLNRHQASCHFFKRSSIIATQKRQQRARDATLANLVTNLQLANITLRVSDLSVLKAD
jgi:hypothetical protein